APTLDHNLNVSNHQGSYHALVVESPQFLERAAAARQDDQVDATLREDALQGRDDGGRSRLALDHGRREDELDERVAAANDVANVLPYGTHRRSDHPDPPRPARQRPLAVLVEEALRGQPSTERLVARMQVAGPRRREGFDVELVDALRLVGAHPAVANDRHPVLWPHRGARELLAEDNGPDLRASVLQGEEAVARRRKRGRGDLPRDPDVGQRQVSVEQRPNAAVEVRDAQDAGRERVRLPKRRPLGCEVSHLRRTPSVNPRPE